MYYTYILKSLKNDRYYTGSTDNLNKRLCEHNSGRSKYTRSTRPFKLMHYETFQSRAEAVQREKYFKTGKGREKFKKLIMGL